MYPYVRIFGAALQSYYLCAALAGAVGTVLAGMALRKRKQGIWSVLLPLLAVVTSLIGARLLNYLTNPGAFRNGLSVWTPTYRQLSLMGGLAAGAATVVVFCILRKEKPAGIADAFPVPAAAGIVLLKLGCFLNGCCHGKPTQGPFGMIFPANEFKYRFINSLKTVSAKSPVVHPTQLYEIAGAVLAITAALVLPHVLRLREGSRAAIFAALFSAARWIVLPFRELPYDRRVVTVFYPCLYAAIILSAGLYLLRHGFERRKKEKKEKTGEDTQK